MLYAVDRNVRRPKTRPWPSRASLAALASIALAIGLLTSLSTADAAPSRPAPALHVSAAYAEGGGVVVGVSLKAAKNARCSTRVSAGGTSFKLPTARATHRRVGWKWEVPSGAPRGKWQFRSTCKSRHHRAARHHTSKQLFPGILGDGGLVFPGSVAITAGHGPGHRKNNEPGKPTDDEGGKGAGGNTFAPGYCTWGAWNLAPWLGSAVWGHAKTWAKHAQDSGLSVGTTPTVGSVFVKQSNGYGHVGVVTAVRGDGTIETNEMNGGTIIPNTDSKTTEFNQYVTHVRSPVGLQFIYAPRTTPGMWVNHIVQWDGDTKAQKTSWLIGPDGNRRWIPTTAIYWCLVGKGVPTTDPLPGTVLDTYPDLNGQWADCGPGGYGAGSGTAPTEPTTPTTPAPTTPAPSTPAPAAPTYYETTGSETHTWTNYTNAGGTEGPVIAKNATVQIACRLTGFRVADGNTWWYRIAQSPWNGQYYASADAFYNNGQTSGSLKGTPWVDPSVPMC